MPSLKDKSLKGLFWDFTGRIGLQGVGFFVSIVLARILTPEDFGLLAIITVFINLAACFLDFGFGTALIQKSEVQESHYASVFYMNVAMGLVLAAIVFSSAPFLAALYGNPQLINLTRLMSLSFIVNSFGNVPRSKLRREMNFKAISITNALAALISGAGAVYMAWKGYGVWSLAVQSITNQLLANSLLFFFYRTRFSLRFSFQSLKELWEFSSRMFLGGLLDVFFVNADSLVIGKVLNTSTLGFYYRAKSLEKFSFRYTASTLAGVLLPSLSSLQNDPEKLKHAVIKVFHLVSFFSFLGCGLLLVTGRECIILLFSAKWEPSVLMFQILISGAFSLHIFNLFYNTLLGTGNVNNYLFINVVHKVSLFFNFATLITWGMNPFLVTFSMINLIIFFMGMFYVTRILQCGALLYTQTLKYLFTYCTSVALTFLIKHACGTANLYYCLIIGAVNFSVLFLLLTYLTRCEALNVVGTELKILLQKRTRCLSWF